MDVRSSTHVIEIRSDVVIKRYRSCRWNEPEREWRALTLLDAYAPGLAPVPIKADLTGRPPVVAMSRLEGTALTAPVTDRQAQAMAEAIATLQGAVPRQVLGDLPPRAGHAAEMLDQVRRLCPSRPPVGLPPLIRRALDAAAGWLRQPVLDYMVRVQVMPVLGTGDGNRSNFLWDGTRARLVDFEYSGRSDRAFELAEVAEHISMWADGDVDLMPALSGFQLSRAETEHLYEYRRLMRVYWLLALLPGGPGHDRNRGGTLELQARRLLALLR